MRRRASTSGSSAGASRERSRSPETAADPKRRSTSGRRHLLLAVGIGLIVLAADQATKAWASSNLPYDRLVPVIPHWFGFGLLHNSGAAFGSLGGRNQVLTLVTIGLLVAFAWLLFRGALYGPLAAVSLGAVLGGGLGNLLLGRALQALDGAGGLVVFRDVEGRWNRDTFSLPGKPGRLADVAPILEALVQWALHTERPVLIEDLPRSSWSRHLLHGAQPPD